MSSISPEKWHLLPTFPSFGSLTDDRNGGAVGPFEEKRFDSLRETSIGLVEIHAGKDGFNFLAAEIGTGLLYEKSGRLTDVGIDVLSYCESCSEEDCEKMGGDSLDEMLGAMVESDDQIFISFDFNENTVAVVKRNTNSGKSLMMSAIEDVDFSISTALRVKYDEYYMFVGFTMVEDELRFGLMITPVDEGYNPQKTIMTMSILNDCNYQTFLNSPSPDKYDKLARRIFFVGH